MTVRFLIVNVFEDCEDTSFSTEEMRVMNVSREKAERIKDWACGLQINSLNIFCELSPEATLYALSRCRAAGGLSTLPLIQYNVHGLRGLLGAPTFTAGNDIREWIMEAYCG